MADRYINTVCFVRSYEYYGGYYKEGAEVLKRHIELYNKYNLPATYLLEYDAMVRNEYRRIIEENAGRNSEIGLWLEIVGELALDAAVEWRSERGRSWDHYACPGFIISYSSEEKKKLIDTAMEQFKKYFGAYPKTVGSWLMDSEAMAYMSDNYAVDAFIICREQWGMDGYTLWGGPYYGPYYPSKENMLCPAQSEKNKINTPVFRMYVNDPIYCYYEFAMDKINGINYGLFTQEPVWLRGQDSAWVEWCMDSVFNKKAAGFLYYQLGQENTFGWSEELSRGLEMQCSFAVDNQEKYGYEFCTVGEMGRSFKAEYETTPDSLRFALTDWAKRGNQSVWFNSARYRCNIFSDGKRTRIRDLYLFSEDYRDVYLDAPCRTRGAIYDNLPIMDGVRFSYGELKNPDTYRQQQISAEDCAEIYIGEGKIEACSYDGDAAEVLLNVCGGLRIRLMEASIELLPNGGEIPELIFKAGDGISDICKIGSKAVIYNHNGFGYALKLLSGHIENMSLISENGVLKLGFGKS